VPGVFPLRGLGDVVHEVHLALRRPCWLPARGQGAQVDADAALGGLAGTLVRVEVRVGLLGRRQGLLERCRRTVRATVDRMRSSWGRFYESVSAVIYGQNRSRV
jgi:hypothetical protein